MGDLEKFSDEVLGRFLAQITDEVFLLIQNDRDLMQKYLKMCDSKGHEVVNRFIGKQVKNRFKLENLPLRNDSPKSTLIQSHQIFE
ncbi:MAG: hypothetical protein Kow0029_30830 [Candidatus Rifleibacteriota bacterium]|jgi:hypothetical protein